MTQPYCVQTDGLELVASYEDVQCWGPKDRFEKHCFRAYYAIVLRQERYAKDKWTTVLKLVRVTTRWGGIENVFTMIVHLWQILADVTLRHLVTPGNCCSRAAYATTVIVLIHIMAHGIYLHKQ